MMPNFLKSTNSQSNWKSSFPLLVSMFHWIKGKNYRKTPHFFDFPFNQSNECCGDGKRTWFPVVFPGFPPRMVIKNAGTDL
jgi:hypothetical protein